jgi:hypothetical protein
MSHLFLKDNVDLAIFSMHDFSDHIMSFSSSSRRSSASVVNPKTAKHPSNPIQVISSGLMAFLFLCLSLIFIIQNLQLENESLRQELTALQSILAIPIDANHRYTHFRYQIFSLEKQVALLTRLLDAKREAVATCETILLELNRFLQ